MGLQCVNCRNTNGIVMYDEDDLLPISGLQHLAFCERQWALIHIEGIWTENRLTVEGKHLHERVHQEESETRGNVRIARGLRLRSLRLGLSGQADVVEFHAGEGTEVPFPVEYKRGRPKPDRCDEVQLCAQALCLEEMLDTTIQTGAIFYGQPRRRHDVILDDNLRTETKTLIAKMHALFHKGETPAATYEKKCDHCSLQRCCLPKTAACHKRVDAYIKQIFEDMEQGDK